MRRYTILALYLMLGASLFDSTAHAADLNATQDRGRYMILVGSCNDCHTAGFPEKAGNVPESQWLLGSSVGFQGPWGTSYPANLRLAAARYDEAGFIARARSELLPPMPWFNLVKMSDADLGAIYQYIRSLGDVGEPTPAYVPPGGVVETPYIVFTPQIDPPAVSKK